MQSSRWQKLADVQRAWTCYRPATGPVAERIKFIRDRVAQGIDPLYVGELVREGVENDWPYIFTDNEPEPLIEARFAAIKEGFNQIRGRIPRR